MREPRELPLPCRALAAEGFEPPDLCSQRMATALGLVCIGYGSLAIFGNCIYGSGLRGVPPNGRDMVDAMQKLQRSEQESQASHAIGHVESTDSSSIPVTRVN
jgi:hypothetical protein